MSEFLRVRLLKLRAGLAITIVYLCTGTCADLQEPDRNRTRPKGGIGQCAVPRATRLLPRRVFPRLQAHKRNRSADSGSYARPKARKSGDRRGRAGRKDARGGSCQRAAQIGAQLLEGQGSGVARTPNQNVVMAGLAVGGQVKPGDFAQAALGAVAGDRVSDLL